MSFQADDLPSAFEEKLDRQLTAGERRSLNAAKRRRDIYGDSKRRSPRMSADSGRVGEHDKPMIQKDEWAEKEEVVQAHLERLKKSG